MRFKEDGTSSEEEEDDEPVVVRRRSGFRMVTTTTAAGSQAAANAQVQPIHPQESPEEAERQRQLEELHRKADIEAEEQRLLA
ncbi:hypothetical protein FO519_006129, partial [Halicephalobus sp. NKZ332]